MWVFSRACRTTLTESRIIVPSCVLCIICVFELESHAEFNSKCEIAVPDVFRLADVESLFSSHFEMCTYAHSMNNIGVILSHLEIAATSPIEFGTIIVRTRTILYLAGLNLRFSSLIVVLCVSKVRLLFRVFCLSIFEVIAYLYRTLSHLGSDDDSSVHSFVRLLASIHEIVHVFTLRCECLYMCTIHTKKCSIYT